MYANKFNVVEMQFVDQTLVIKRVAIVWMVSVAIH